MANITAEKNAKSVFTAVGLWLLWGKLCHDQRQPLRLFGHQYRAAIP
jgi:hypothetical protein